MASPRTWGIILAAILLVAGAAPAAWGRGSPSVAALQVALRAKGLYGDTVDGVAGPATRTAGRRFPRRPGPAAHGLAGPRPRPAPRPPRRPPPPPRRLPRRKRR